MKTTFLTGKSGVGKSTWIIHKMRELISSGEKSIGGYMTCRCFWNRSVAGYGIRDAYEYLTETEAVFPPKVVSPSFSDKDKQQKWKMFQVHQKDVDFSVEKFREYTDPLLDMDCDIIICDELGGADFIDDDFVRKILELSEKKILVGVYREIEDFDFFCMKRKYSFEEGERILKNRKLFEKSLGNGIRLLKKKIESI